MNCANHPLVESVAFCGSCGRALCQECKRDVRGTIYCENCLATRMQNSPQPPALGASGGPSPGVALVLGFIPGVGAAYCGQVLKGLVEVLIFISLWQLADRVEVFGWLVAAFWIYMAIDSYHMARRRQLGLPSEEWFGLGNKKLNTPLWAGLLIGLGVLFLLDNLGIPVFHHISRLWPVLLIALGFVLLQRRMSGGGRGTQSGP
jgi:hypothetical protein